MTVQAEAEDLIEAAETQSFLVLLPPGATSEAKAPTEKVPDRTVLAKHLTEYTARNTFDYFIHKDLGGFLRRSWIFTSRTSNSSRRYRERGGPQS